jgi:hypothetical protein
VNPLNKTLHKFILILVKQGRLQKGDAGEEFTTAKTSTKKQ